MLMGLVDPIDLATHATDGRTADARGRGRREDSLNQ